MTTIALESETASTVRTSRRRASRGATVLAAAVAVVLVAAVWEGSKALFALPGSVLPHLADVLSYVMATDPSGRSNLGTLLANLAVTIGEALVGLLVGVVIGLLVGIGSGLWAAVGRAVSPLLVLSQTMPIVAIAPAIVILFGRNWTSMATLAAILTFFPIAVSVAGRVRLIEEDDRQLFSSFGARRFRLFWSLEVPIALLGVAAAMRTAAALALVGALVAELPSGVQTGIAAFLLSASSHYSTEPEALWAAALIAMLGGVVLSAVADYGFTLLLRALLRSRRPETGENP